MTDAPAYRQQYDRVKRWHARFGAIDQGRAHEMDSDNYVDEIYAFFLNCFHLKDWLKEDSSVPPAARGQVEQWLKDNRALRLCADIANALKHLRLTRKQHSDETPSFGKRAFALDLGAGPTASIALKYEIEATGGAVDAFVLATDCVKAWDEFFVTHQL